MPDVLALAVQELKSIDTQLAALKARADELRTFIKIGSELTSKERSAEVQTGNGEIVSHTPPVTALEPMKTRAIRSAMVVLQNGKPKTAAQLVQEIASMGVIVGGKDPASNLSAILSQDKAHFRNIKGRGYVLAKPKKTEPVDVAASTGSERLDPFNAPKQGTAVAAD